MAIVKTRRTEMTYELDTGTIWTPNDMQQMIKEMEADGAPAEAEITWNPKANSYSVEWVND